MEDKDKTIEVIKAAMEMEEQAKKTEKLEKNEESDKTMDVKIDESTNLNETINDKVKSSKSLLKGSKSKELAAKDEKILELNDRLMRSLAEFDNFRKRSEKEKSQMYDLGVKSIIEKILPVIDNFERGLDSVKESDKDSPLVQGFNMIYKQLMSTMEEIGVKVIEAVGNEFDPNFHNAVMHGEDEELGENVVSEEYQKGYMYHDTVVRHSMVKVVN